MEFEIARILASQKGNATLSARHILLREMRKPLAQTLYSVAANRAKTKRIKN